PHRSAAQGSVIGNDDEACAGEARLGDEALERMQDLVQALTYRGLLWTWQEQHRFISDRPEIGIRPKGDAAATQSCHKSVSGSRIANHRPSAADQRALPHVGWHQVDPVQS